ncbi:MAG: hypothetical protein SNJ80_06480, partial [Anaerolinea sp.]
RPVTEEGVTEHSDVGVRLAKVTREQEQQRQGAPLNVGQQYVCVSCVTIETIGRMHETLEHEHSNS